MTHLDVLTEQAARAKEIVIAAPYMKDRALRGILRAIRDLEMLTCVARWTTTDILSGASDVSCRRIVLDHGGTFRLHPRLHAKYFRFDERVLIGSANVTASGLGLSTQSNLEILSEPATSFDALDFESRLVRESHLVTESEADLWAGLTSLAVPDVGRQATDPVQWIPATREPAHVWLAYANILEEIPSDDERRLASQDVAALGIPEGLSRADFDLWVGARLAQSEFVRDVRDVRDIPEVEGWDALAERWDTIRSKALRTRSTIEAWLAEFWD